MNIAFGREGLEVLGMLPDDVPADVDASFAAGARSVAVDLGDDPVADWKPEYRDETFHGVLVVASWDPKPRHALTRARSKMDETLALFPRGGLLEAHREECMVRESTVDGVPQSGHEHFGYADGVSQPGVEGLTLPVAADDQGFPGQDLVKAGDFVLGGDYPREDGSDNRPSLAWVANGSYMVVRRLSQDVDAFNAYVASSWRGLADSEEQFGARLIGRWKNGSPLALEPSAPSPSQDEKHPEENNDFQFGPDPAHPDKVGGDPRQERCPFAAHIRRVYPRDDLPDDASDRRRILRAGIAFGADSDADKGLLFVCYQSSIVDKFEFIQKAWANSATFPFGLAQPGMDVPPEPGPDLVIGQGAARRRATWPTGELPESPTFVVSTGAAYFFIPSVSALKLMADPATQGG